MMLINLKTLQGQTFRYVDHCLSPRTHTAHQKVQITIFLLNKRTFFFGLMGNFPFSPHSVGVSSVVLQALSSWNHIILFSPSSWVMCGTSAGSAWAASSVGASSGQTNPHLVIFRRKFTLDSKTSERSWPSMKTPLTIEEHQIPDHAAIFL